MTILGRFLFSFVIGLFASWVIYSIYHAGFEAGKASGATELRIGQRVVFITPDGRIGEIAGSEDNTAIIESIEGNTVGIRWMDGDVSGTNHSVVPKSQVRPLRLVKGDEP